MAHRTYDKAIIEDYGKVKMVFFYLGSVNFDMDYFKDMPIDAVIKRVKRYATKIQVLTK